MVDTAAETSINVKISEFVQTDSEKGTITAAVIQESDDGLGLDNYKADIYSVETVDRIVTEINTAIDGVLYTSNQGDSLLGQTIAQKETESIARDQSLSDRLDQEVTDRQDGDTALSLRIAQEVNDRQDADVTLNLRIDQEIVARTEADVALNLRIDGVESDLDDETLARQAADEQLQDNIDTEEESRIEADAALSDRIDNSDSDIDTERQERIAADNALGIRIDGVQSDLSDETAARISGDNALGVRIDGVQSDLSDETAARIAGDNALGVRIDDETAARIAADNVLQSNIDTNTTEIARVDSAKEDNIPYGQAGYMTVVNDTGDGFEFIPQPSYDFIQMRGTLTEYTAGVDPTIIAIVGADPLNDFLYKDVPPNIPTTIAIVGADPLNDFLYKDVPPNIPTTTEEGVQLSPNGYTYIAQENFDAEISDGAGVISITSGDFLIWTGDIWSHILVEVGTGVDGVNNLTGMITLAGTDGITVTTNTSNNTITVTVDSTVARTSELNALIARVTQNEQEIVSILQSIVYIEGVLDTHTTQIGNNATAINALTDRVGQNESDIESIYEDIGAHLGDEANPHSVTYTQTGAAAATHQHGWDEVTGKPAFATRWPSYTEVTDKPTTYPPSAHEHIWTNITDPPTTATRWPTFDEVTGKPTTYPPSAHEHAWGEITGKPTTYPPAAHSHPWDQVTEKPAQATRWPTYAEVTEKPATFPPSGHTHTGSEISDLDSVVEAAVNAALVVIDNQRYPVGTLITTKHNTNPATLGYPGTWAAIEADTSLHAVAADDAALGTIVGSNVPAVPLLEHTHTGPNHTHTTPAHTHPNASANTSNFVRMTGGRQESGGADGLRNGTWTIANGSTVKIYTGGNSGTIQGTFFNGANTTLSVTVATPSGGNGTTGAGGTDNTGSAGTASVTLDVRGKRLLTVTWERMA